MGGGYGGELERWSGVNDFRGFLAQSAGRRRLSQPAPHTITQRLGAWYVHDANRLDGQETWQQRLASTGIHMYMNNQSA